jgi:hypothetical protein
MITAQVTMMSFISSSDSEMFPKIAQLWHLWRPDVRPTPQANDFETTAKWAFFLKPGDLSRWPSELLDELDITFRKIFISNVDDLSLVRGFGNTDDPNFMSMFSRYTVQLAKDARAWYTMRADSLPPLMLSRLGYYFSQPDLHRYLPLPTRSFLIAVDHWWRTHRAMFVEVSSFIWL